MILFIDNYDSFVYNLTRYMVELGQEINIVRNDEITIEEIEALSPRGIVLSPGPCSPTEAGICNDVIRYLSGKIPIFGVCLGHQCIGEVFGAKVVRADYPMHGKRSQINVDNSDIMFKGLPNRFEVMRYHSLVIDPDTLPSCLKVTATLENSRMIMALSHQEHKTYGVQFHPESVGTDHGHKLLENFLSSLT